MNRSIVLERDFLHVGCLPVFALHVKRYRISVIVLFSSKRFTCPVLFFFLSFYFIDRVSLQVTLITLQIPTSKPKLLTQDLFSVTIN